MKSIARYSTNIEAQFARDYLITHGIQAEIQGSKEYSAFVVGGDLGTYDIFVIEQLCEKAQALLAQASAPTEQRITAIEPKSYFNRVVLFAMLAMILPFVFTYASLKNLALYRKAEPDSSKKTMFTLLGAILQIPGVVTILFLINAQLEHPFSLLKWF